MMIAAIVIASIVAWFSLGLAAGFQMARRAYLHEQTAYPTLARGRPEFGEPEARTMLVVGTVFGPFSALYYVLSASAKKLTLQAVPELKRALLAEEEKAQIARLAELEKQIDEAHKQIGVPLMKRLS